jgi:hypothetical protein
MRELTVVEMSLVGGGTDGWRAGFDIAAGGLLGGVAGTFIGMNAGVPVGVEGLVFLLSGGIYVNALAGAIIGMGIGVAAGALFAVGREIITG